MSMNVYVILAKNKESFPKSGYMSFALSTELPSPLKTRWQSPKSPYIRANRKWMTGYLSSQGEGMLGQMFSCLPLSRDHQAYFRFLSIFFSFFFRNMTKWIKEIYKSDFFRRLVRSLLYREREVTNAALNKLEWKRFFS